MRQELVSARVAVRRKRVVFRRSDQLPISDGRLRSLLFDKSRVTRLVKHAISDGNRLN